MVLASARGQGHRGSLPRAWVFSSCTCNLQWAGAASLETPRSIKRCSLLHWASLMARTIKNLPAMQETWVQSLGWKDPHTPREGNGNPLQYSCLKNSRDRLAGYSPQDCNKLDTAERLSLQPAVLVSVLWRHRHRRSWRGGCFKGLTHTTAEVSHICRAGSTPGVQVRVEAAASSLRSAGQQAGNSGKVSPV